MLIKIISIVGSIIPLIIIWVLLDVNLEDITKIGVIPFILASIAAIARLVIQGLRFHYYLKSFVKSISILKEIEVRIGSEFVALTTPSYIGGEFVRLAWMEKHGIHIGKGIWIVMIEIISDVLVGSILSYIAAIYALLAQDYLIALIIIIVVTPILSAYIMLLVLSSRNTLQLPRFIYKIIRIFGKDKSERWIKGIDEALRVLSSEARENLRSLRVFAVGFTLTFLSLLCYALAFMILADAYVGLFESLLAIGASLALAAIPITPGGSGLSELGIGYYLKIFDLDPITFGSIIIAWRLVTYHLLLITSWGMLMHITMRWKRG